MFIVFLLLLLLSLIPIRIRICAHIHNFKAEADIKIVCVFVIPIKCRIYNSLKNPLDFKIRFFGREKDFNKILKTDVSEKTKRNIEKINPFKIIVRYIKGVEIIGRAGIYGRPDCSAVIAGATNSLFITALLMAGIKKARVRFLPEFTDDVFETRFKCIISVNIVNIIKEAIRGYKEMKYE